MFPAVGQASPPSTQPQHSPALLHLYASWVTRCYLGGPRAARPSPTRDMRKQISVAPNPSDFNEVPFPFPFPPRSHSRLKLKSHSHFFPPSKSQFPTNHISLFVSQLNRDIWVFIYGDFSLQIAYLYCLILLSNGHDLICIRHRLSLVSSNDGRLQLASAC